MWRLDRARILLYVIAGVSAAGLAIWLGLAALHRESDPDDDSTSSRVETEKDDEKDDGRKEPLSKDKREVSQEERAELLTRAQLWRQPKVPIGRASLQGDTVDEVTCRFKISELGGTTPKFDCELEGGEEIRIKYGNGPEVPAEAAATRLLKTLGFAADDITLVRTLRCHGCPDEPFSTMRAVDITQAAALYKTLVDYNDVEVFDWVALERKFDARPIESGKIEGWSFFELDAIDPSKGGAPRAHVDAIRLVSVLLAHWDNKSENQRFVCVSREWAKDDRCAAPYLVLQDVGATFGPSKLDLDAWQKATVWEDRDTCTVSMRDLPFEGATFGQAKITEAGRQFAGSLLSQLSDQQLTDLFTHARFGEKRGLFTPTRPVSDWVTTFKRKVTSITEGPRCPST
jgi:hypothetical protein